MGDVAPIIDDQKRLVSLSAEARGAAYRIAVMAQHATGGEEALAYAEAAAKFVDIAERS